MCFLAGCAHFEAKPLSPEPTAAQFEARTLDDPGLRRYIEGNGFSTAKEWPRPSWDLPALTLAAFYYHPDMEVARAKLAGAEAAILTAGARPNPTAAFSPTTNADAGGLSPWTLGFTLDAPIETAGKRGYRIAQARYLANSARLNVAATAWLIRSRVRRSLLELYAANLNQQLLTQQQAVQTQTVEVLEDRWKAGQSSLFEVQFVRVAAAQTTLQLRDAQKQSDQARVRLADAIGAPVDALTDIVFSFSTFDRLPASEDAGAFRREALLNRPDVLGALADYDASQSALQLEIAKQYPDLHLGPGHAWDQGANKYSLGVSLMLPVFNQNQGPIAEAEAHRRQAGAALAALQARVLGEVDAAFAGYRDALRKRNTTDSLWADQQQRMQSMQELFDAGAADRLEWLQTQRELHAGELTQSTALVEAQQALGLLEDAMQRPSDTIGRSGSPPLPPERKPD
ncbi:MAG: TolC family protein [Phycisphaerae bacterium]|nr:TolC family protein [Phycisphaerae bacterium]